MQPVLLGIRIQAPVASLLVFTERTGLVPLIHLAVGCQHLDAPDCDEPNHDPQFINLLTIKAVVETIGTLMTLLPITYLMGLNPETTERKSAMNVLLNNLLSFGAHVLDRQEEDILPESDNAIAGCWCILDGASSARYSRSSRTGVANAPASVRRAVQP